MACLFDARSIPDGAEVVLQFAVSKDGVVWEPYGPSALFVGDSKRLDPEGNPATACGFAFAQARMIYDKNTKQQTGIEAKYSGVQVKLLAKVAKGDIATAFAAVPADPIIQVGPLGHQSISYVQVATVSVNNGTSMVTPAMTTTTGNLLHVDVQAFDGGGLHTPSSDTYSNTYTRINDLTGYNSSWAQQQFYAKNITGGASHTLTYVVQYGQMALVEIAGADTTAPLDNSAESQSNTVATGTTNQADELIVVCGVRASGNTETKDAALTLISDFSITGRTTERLNNGYQIVSSTGNYSYTTTSAQSSMVATYKAAAGGGAAASIAWRRRGSKLSQYMR